ncbi:MAG: PadR family transcriptional regulator [Candidatus Dormibacteraeota bacterium]|nr:PadR family transcriptional regulator [Candidatus Dormibacteraeota bacterium]
MLEGELGPAWETRQSHLYLTLARMERDGLVSGRRIRQQALPDRQVLELTAKGRAMAGRWLMSAEPSSEMVVKLAVARLARPELFADLAATIADDVAGRLKTLRQLSASLAVGFQQQALALEIARRQAEIRWLSSIRDDTTAILAQPRSPKVGRRDERRSERLA